MEVRALVVATDNITASMVRRGLTSVGVTIDEGVKVEDTLARLRKVRYEGIVIDLSVAGGKELLASVRKEPSSKTAVVFALAEGKAPMREAFQGGATFVIEKPLSLDRTVRCFRAAYGLIIGERRRYYRHRISIPIAIERSGREPVVGYSIDLSTGGMLLECPIDLGSDQKTKIQFGLPGIGEKIAVACDVIWSKSGRAGLRFTRFSKDAKDNLAGWLTAQMEKDPMARTPEGQSKFPTPA